MEDPAYFSVAGSQDVDPFTNSSAMFNSEGLLMSPPSIMMFFSQCQNQGGDAHQGP